MSTTTVYQSRRYGRNSRFMAAAIFLCGWLPDYKPGEVPGDQPQRSGGMKA